MEKVFLSVLNMSLTASFIIAAIMLVRLPLKKAPKLISYALWAVAGFRLAFPFTLESVFSLIPFKAAPIPRDIAMQAVPRIDSGITAIDNLVSSALPAATPAASANPLQLWVAVGAYVWIIGLAAMLIYSVVSIILLKRRLRGAVCVEGNLYEASNLKTPFVIGLFNPKIYIPSKLSEEERGYIVLHERTHIRRRDHAVKMLAYLVLCLHWFNPLAWAAFVLMGADMEMSCDERVMKELGMGIKSAYSMSLVRVAAGRRIINGSPLAFGEGGMKERIKNVLNFKKRSRIVIITAIALVAVLTTGFAVSRAGAPVEPPEITVKSGDAEIFWTVGKNKWDGNIYDRADNFQSQQERILNRAMPYVKNGEKISISFGNTKPDSVELSEIILNERGEPKWRTGEHPMEYNVSVAPLSGKCSFIVKQNFATAFSSFSGDYAPGNTIKGYKMVCRWGDNECEYAFVILGDAAITMIPVDGETEIDVEPQFVYGPPSIRLYEYDTSGPDGYGDVVKHLVRELRSDGGWTTLADTIFIEVLVPVGTVSVKTYYAETGTEATEHVMLESTYSEPYRGLPADVQSPTGNTWRALDYFPDGFLGHIWAGTTDANGVEHHSEIINVNSPFDSNGNPLYLEWERQGGRYMTLDDVRDIAQKRGRDLKHEDFTGFLNSHKIFDRGEEWHYFIDENWYLKVVLNVLDGRESVSTRLEPYGYEFQPQSGIDICYEDVDEYIAYVEAYDGSQTQLSDAELDAARFAALEYYKPTGFGISEITYIEDATEYAGSVIVSRVKGKLAGFYTSEAKLGVQRRIVLTQTDDGNWEVINEGY